MVARGLVQHIAGAGDQNGVMVAVDQGGKAIKARGGGKEAAVVAHHDILIVSDGGKLAQGAAGGIGEAVAARRCGAAGGNRGIDDGTVAGAAAKVAGEPGGGAVAVNRDVAVEQGEQRHDHSRRAETTLRGVVAEQRLLDRMRLGSAPRDILDGHQLLAVQGAEKRHAGIDRPVDHGAVAARAESDRAGTAFAAAAAFLAAGPPVDMAEMVEQSRIRREIGQLNDTASAQEAYCSAHRLTSHGSPMGSLSLNCTGGKRAK